MNKKVLAGIAAGLLTTAVLVLVGAGAYRAGQRSDATIEVVGGATEGSGDIGRTVLVAGDGFRDGWHGPGPGIVIFPLIVIGLVFLFASRRRGGGPGGWHGGPFNADLDDWHRRAHAPVAVTTPTPAAPPAAATPPPADPTT